MKKYHEIEIALGYENTYFGEITKDKINDGSYGLKNRGFFNLLFMLFY